MKTNLQNDIDKLKNDYINFTKDVEYFIEKSIKEIQENNIINILEETLGIEIGVIPLVKVYLKIKLGDIFYAVLTPTVGSEQGGIRPVLIIQNNKGNRYSP